MRRTLAGLLLLCLPTLGLSARERLSLDGGWRFHLGDAPDAGSLFADREDADLAKTREADLTTPAAPAADQGAPFVSFAAPRYDDRAWTAVDLPHDWVVALPFDPQADLGHGFKPVGPGFPGTSIGWYRRRFDAPASAHGAQVRVEFDGIYRDSRVWLNGHYLGRHTSGYTGARYDVTPYLRLDAPNELVVRADASRFEGWFYEGAGIYRHAWLVTVGAIHLAPDELAVTTRFAGPAPEGAATVELTARLAGPAGSFPGAVRAWFRILAPDGAEAAAATGAPDRDGRLHCTLSLPQPRLWSPEIPALYTLETVITAGGTETDRGRTRFGVRTVGFDAARGFLLNGAPYPIQGTCNHQDHAGVGAALPDALQYYRIAKLKEMGANAYRTSHNPPTPELLQACDELGMLVMDETRRFSDEPAAQNDFAELIRRDRNHPSVVIWSVGNEETEIQSTPTGRRIAGALQALARRLDPSRPVTYAANNGALFEGANAVIEVRGWNYNLSPATDQYHREHPAQPNIGSEQGSTVATRGIYATDKARGHVSAYDDNDINPTRGGGRTVQRWTTIFAARPWLSGGFIWTGFDYRGEPTPCKWPAISSHFGVLDLCGFPKDNFYYYQAWWTQKPVLHLLPHWNWPDRRGQPVEVDCYSNCESVELFVNGKSAGWKPMPRHGKLSWLVRYEPGAISAVGWNFGQKRAETRVETTGSPAALRLRRDESAATRRAGDADVVAIEVVDAAGRVVPTAANEIRFSVAGPARLLGVGNGDPASHEPDQANQRRAFNGLAQAILQLAPHAGAARLTAQSPGLVSATLILPSRP